MSHRNDRMDPDSTPADYQKDTPVLPMPAVDNTMLLHRVFDGPQLRAVRDLAAEHHLSERALIRAALREYHLNNERRKAGETCVWSGDTQRARDFAGPLVSNSLVDS